MAAERVSTRDRILDAAIRLLARQGYAATGIKQIVEEAGAPLGSVYHHFPGGKEQIGIEALRRMGERVRRTIESAALVSDMPEAFRNYFAVHAERLRDSGWTAGCPVANVSLEAASDNETIRVVCREVFEDWKATMAGVLEQAGIEPDVAGALATFILSSYEGSLNLSRTVRDMDPMLTSGDAVAGVLRARLVEGASATPA